MKFLYSLLLALGLAFPNLHAQELFYSKAQKFNANKDQFSIGGWVNNRLNIFYTDKKESFIDLYDNNMDRKAIVTLNFMPTLVNQVKLLPLKQKSLLVFSTTLNNKEAFYVAALDTSSKIIGRPKLLDEAQQDFFGGTKFDYNLIHSASHNKVGVFAYRVKNDKLEFQLTEVNDSLTIIHSSSHKIPTKDFYGVSQIILKDDGSLVVLMTDLATNKNDEVAEAMVYYITPTGNKTADIKAFPFDFGDVFTANLFLKENLNHSNLLHFAGLTNDKNGNSNGIFSGKIDLDAPNNSAIIGQSSQNDSLTLKYDKRRNYNSFKFIIQDMIIKNDGGLVLISEAYTRLVRTSYSGPTYYSGFGSMGTTRYYEYIYGDILLLDVDAQSNLLQSNRINKYQKSIDDYGFYSSFALLNTGNYLGFVYNELSTRNNKVSSSIIGNNDEVIKNDLSTNSDNEIKWIPKLALQTNARELVIPILDKNKLSFVKLNY